MCFLLMTLVLVLILNPLLDFFLVYQADVSIFYTSNLYWWGKGWPVDGLPFPDTGCPVPDVSIYYMSNINELPDGILFHWFCKCTPPWMFLPLDIPSEYRPEHVTFRLLCVIFKFPSRIFYRRVPGFATDCPCGVWCRGLTTCLLYVDTIIVAAEPPPQVHPLKNMSPRRSINILTCYTAIKTNIKKRRGGTLSSHVSLLYEAVAIIFYCTYDPKSPHKKCKYVELSIQHGGSRAQPWCLCPT